MQNSRPDSVMLSIRGNKGGSIIGTLTNAIGLLIAITLGEGPNAY
jgi:hypothetical protein